MSEQEPVTTTVTSTSTPTVVAFSRCHTVLLTNTGHRDAIVRVEGSSRGETLRPGALLTLHPRGVAVSAVLAPVSAHLRPGATVSTSTTVVAAGIDDYQESPERPLIPDRSVN